MTDSKETISELPPAYTKHYGGYLQLIESLHDKSQALQRVKPIWDKCADKTEYLHQPLKALGRAPSSDIAEYQEYCRLPHQSFSHVLTLRDIEVLLALANITQIIWFDDCPRTDPIEIFINMGMPSTVDLPTYSLFRQLICRYLQYRDVEVGLHWGDVVVAQVNTGPFGGNHYGMLIYDGDKLVKMTANEYYHEEFIPMVPSGFEVITMNIPGKGRSIPIDYWFGPANGFVLINTTKLDVLKITTRAEVKGEGGEIHTIGNIEVKGSKLVENTNLLTIYGSIDIHYGGQYHKIIIEYDDWPYQVPEGRKYGDEYDEPTIALPTIELYDSFRTAEHFRVDRTSELPSYFLYFQYRAITKEQQDSLRQQRRIIRTQLPQYLLLPELYSIVGEYVV